MRDLATHPAARGLDDDAAVLEVGGETLVLTHDTLIQGVHVRMDEDPADIAWKLVAVNLSDLAAKGAVPLGVLVSHALGPDDERFVEGLRAVLAAHDVPLLGGDTVGGMTTRAWGCTAIGRASHSPVPDRSRARPGDTIHVTGELGRAMLGMEERGSGSANDLAYRRPTPLLAEGRALAPHVSAMMDVSDGLLLDCWRMAEASGTCFELDSRSFPVAEAARKDACVRWGDDYQLLFTAPEGAVLPVPATRIGVVRPKEAAVLVIDGETVRNSNGLGYSHRA
ncbi:MAG: thiamine-phosphate kinase [Erythrobacter sp.]|nr:thiamine-phosphate kinase [Erythrobacter sp.]